MKEPAKKTLRFADKLCNRCRRGVVIIDELERVEAQCTALREELQKEKERPDYSYEAQDELTALREAAQAAVDEWQTSINLHKMAVLAALLEVKDE